MLKIAALGNLLTTSTRRDGRHQLGYTGTDEGVEDPRGQLQRSSVSGQVGAYKLRDIPARR